MRLVLISTTTILLILGACRIFIPSPPPVNIGFFADSNCLSACWQGLRPGISTLGDLEIFYSQNFTRFSTYTNDTIKLIQFSAIHDGGYYNVIASFNEDELVDMFLRVNKSPSFDLQIDSILTILGNPEDIRVGYGTAVETTATYPYIELYYPDEGYIFHADLDIQSLTDDTIELCVQPDINITEIHIVAPNPIQDMLANTFHTDSESTTRHVNEVLNNLDNWTGYRCYMLSYIHPFDSRD